MARPTITDVFVLLGACVCIVTVGFLDSVSSIVLVKLMQTFNVDNATASWVISIFNGTQNLAGFILAPVVPRLGTRFLAIISGFMTFIGMALAAIFSNTIIFICISYGILAGLGTCGMCICSVVSIQQHFETSYSLPLSITLFVGTVGTLVGAPYMEILSSIYGWRGALLITSALSLHTSVFGLFFKGPIQNDSPLRNLNNESVEQEDEEKKRLVPSSLEMDAYDSLGKNAGDEKEESLGSRVSDLVNVKLLQDPRFLLFAVSRMLNGGTLFVIFQEIPNRAVAYNINELDASFLVSIASFTMLLARLVASALLSVKCVNRYLFYFFTSVLQAVSTITYSFFVDLSTCSVLIGLCGFWMGSSRTVMRFLMYDVVSPENLASAEGWSLTATGVAELLSLPFTGWLIDITSNYDTPFYLVSAYMGVAGICAFSLFAIEL